MHSTQTHTSSRLYAYIPAVHALYIWMRHSVLLSACVIDTWSKTLREFIQRGPKLPLRAPSALSEGSNRPYAAARPNNIVTLFSLHLTQEIPLLKVKMCRNRANNEGRRGNRKLMISKWRSSIYQQSVHPVVLYWLCWWGYEIINSILYGKKITCIAIKIVMR